MSKNEQTKTVTEVVTRYREAQEALRRVTAEQLLPALAEAFRRNPLVKCLVWTQYTPYFNDGDPCEFRVQADADGARSTLPGPGVLRGWDVVAGVAPEGSTDDHDEVEFGEDDDGFICGEDPVFEWSERESAARKQAEAVCEVVTSLPEELLENVLGDGVKVFAWSGGLLTTEYSHD